MNIGEILTEVEATGVALRLDGDKVRIWYPEPQQRERLAAQVSCLRAHRLEVAQFLRAREAVPAMPRGVLLVAWNLKQPPVAIETCAVVTDPGLFARTTLEQLRVALAEPARWVGWTVPQLIDRVAQVGVFVALERPAEGTDSRVPKSPGKRGCVNR